jgi:hypothetical protein
VSSSMSEVLMYPSSVAMYACWLGQSFRRWPKPRQQWHWIPIVCPVEATEDAPARTWKDFLPESEGLGGAATPASAGRLLVGGGTRKEEGLVNPDDGVEHGAYVVPNLLMPYKAHPCNSFSANIANWNNWLTVLKSL